MADLEEASEKVSYGPERKSHKVSDEERKLTAYHESGHAIMATLLPDADPVRKVTIIPRGQAGGYTMMLPREEDPSLQNPTSSHSCASLLAAAALKRSFLMKSPAELPEIFSRSPASFAR